MSRQAIGRVLTILFVAAIAMAEPTSAANTPARGLTLLGSVQLGGPASISRLSTLGSTAFVGNHTLGCPLSGVHIVDFTDPSAPVEVATTQAYSNTAAIDPEAVQIGIRPVLAVGLTPCTLSPGRSGLELYDVSNPSQPDLIASLATSRGVAGMDVTETPDGRVLALLGIPGLEASSEPPRTGDLVIVDISDPAHPVEVGEWGILDEPALGTPVGRGDEPVSQGINVNANAAGTRAYVSYYDAGTAVIDISDPASPAFLGRTSFAPNEEGNAHNAAAGRGGNVLVETTFDESPFHLAFTSSAFAGERPALEALWAGRIASLPGRVLTGEVVDVGRGCPAGSITPGSPEDPYLANPAGKIALIERGVCRFDHKVARAQLAGAIGVVIYNSAPGGDAPVGLSGASPVTLPDGTVVTVIIAALGVGRTTGLLLRDGVQPVTARAEAVYNGWGFVRLFDLQDPSLPAALSEYRTPNSADPDAALTGVFTPSDVKVRGDTAFVAWRNDGVQMLDLSRPGALISVGAWTGQGAPSGAPPVAALGIALSGRLTLDGRLSLPVG